jgi:hypothetical protein
MATIPEKKFEELRDFVKKLYHSFNCVENAPIFDSLEGELKNDFSLYISEGRSLLRDLKPTKQKKCKSTGQVVVVKRSSTKEYYLQQKKRYKDLSKDIAELFDKIAGSDTDSVDDDGDLDESYESSED